MKFRWQLLSILLHTQWVLPILYIRNWVLKCRPFYATADSSVQSADTQRVCVTDGESAPKNIERFLIWKKFDLKLKSYRARWFIIFDSDDLSRLWKWFMQLFYDIHACVCTDQYWQSVGQSLVEGERKSLYRAVKRLHRLPYWKRLHFRFHRKRQTGVWYSEPEFRNPESGYCELSGLKCVCLINIVYVNRSSIQRMVFFKRTIQWEVFRIRESHQTK